MGEQADIDSMGLTEQEEREESAAAVVQERREFDLSVRLRSIQREWPKEPGLMAEAILDIAWLLGVEPWDGVSEFEPSAEPGEWDGALPLG